MTLTFVQDLFAKLHNYLEGGGAGKAERPWWSGIKYYLK